MNGENVRLIDEDVSPLEQDSTIQDMHQSSLLALTRRRKKLLTICSLIALFFGTVTIYAFQISVAWTFVAFCTCTRLALGGNGGQRTSFLSFPACFIWTVAAASACCLAIAQLALGPFSPEALCSLLFGTISAVACGLLAKRSWNSGRNDNDQIPTLSSVSNSSLRYLILSAFLIFGALSVYDSWAAVAVESSSVDNSSFTRGPGGNWIHYFCKGEPSNGTIVVMEPGYMVPSHALYWMQLYLSTKTYVCIIEVSGVGRSQTEQDVSFYADASNIKAVFDTEFDRLDIPVDRRVAVVMGHSRGHISAITFYSHFAHEYKDCRVVSLDGSDCYYGPTDYDLITEYFISPGSISYIFAPAVPFLSGGMRALWGFYSQYALTGGDTMMKDSSHGSDLPDEIVAQFRERFLHPNYWYAAADRSDAWKTDRYNGPSLSDCRKLDDAGDHVFVRADDVTVESVFLTTHKSVVRATHTSLLTYSKFASRAVERFILPQFADVFDL